MISKSIWRRLKQRAENCRVNRWRYLIQAGLRRFLIRKVIEWTCSSPIALENINQLTEPQISLQLLNDHQYWRAHHAALSKSRWLTGRSRTRSRNRPLEKTERARAQIQPVKPFVVEPLAWLLLDVMNAALFFVSPAWSRNSVGQSLMGVIYVWIVLRCLV